jgi:hypothetical protein
VATTTAVELTDVVAGGPASLEQIYVIDDNDDDGSVVVGPGRGGGGGGGGGSQSQSGGEGGGRRLVAKRTPAGNIGGFGGRVGSLARLPREQCALWMEGVHKVWADGKHAVKGIDLCVRYGEACALLGVNGAGAYTRAFACVCACARVRACVCVYCMRTVDQPNKNQVAPARAPPAEYQRSACRFVVVRWCGGNADAEVPRLLTPGMPACTVALACWMLLLGRQEFTAVHGRRQHDRHQRLHQRAGNSRLPGRRQQQGSRARRLHLGHCCCSCRYQGMRGSGTQQFQLL